MFDNIIAKFAHIFFGLPGHFSLVIWAWMFFALFFFLIAPWLAQQRGETWWNMGKKADVVDKERITQCTKKFYFWIQIRDYLKTAGRVVLILFLVFLFLALVSKPA